MAVNCTPGPQPVPDHLQWALRAAQEDMEAFKIAYRLIEAQNERACIELRWERGRGIEVIEIHRKQALRAKPR